MNEELINPQLPKGDIQTMPYAVKFGIIGGLLCVVISVILYIADMQFQSWARWLNTLVLLGIILFAQKNIAQDHPRQEVGFGTLFGAGMWISIILSAIAIGYFLIYVFVIDPDFANTVMEMTRVKMVEKGMSESQIEEALKISAKFMTPPVMGVIGFISSVFFGAIFSLIGAAIFKKER